MLRIASEFKTTLIKNLNHALHSKSITDWALLSAGTVLFITSIVIIVTGISTLHEIKFTSDKTKHSEETISITHSLLQSLTENESAIRGYLLQKNDAFLLKRKDNLERITQWQQKLQQLVLDNNKTQQARVRSVSQLISKKKLIADTIILNAKNGINKNAEQIFEQENYVNVTISIKKIIAEIEEEENENITYYNIEKDNAISRLYRLFFFFIAVLFVLIAVIVTWLSIRYQKKNKKIQQYNNILVTNIQDAVISADLQWRILSWNEGAEKMYGWKKEEAIGRIAHELLQTEHVLSTRDEGVAGLYNTGHVESEVIHTAKDGRKLNIRFSCSAIKNANGSLQRIVTINQDITTFREMEMALKQSNLELEEKVKLRTKELRKVNSLYQVISYVNQLIINTRNEKDLFAGICKIAIEYGGFRMAWIGVTDEQGTVIPQAMAGHEDGYLTATAKIVLNDTPQNICPAVKALASGNYYVCQDITAQQESGLVKEEQLKRGYHSSMVVPLKKFGKTFGLLSVYASTLHFFDEDVIHLMNEAAEDIGHCMEFIETEKQRLHNEELLIERDALTNAFYNTSVDGLLLTSPDGTIYYANQAACDLFGYTEDEIRAIGREGIADTTDPEFHKFVKEREEKGAARYEFLHKKKNGTTFSAEVSSSRFTTPNGQQFASVIIHDLTQRNEREKLIKDYQYAIDQASLVDISDKNGIITYVNDTFCKVSQYSKEELIGNNQRLLNSGYHPKAMFTDLWNTIISGKVWRGELRDKAKDGSIFWLETTIVPFINSHGEITQFVSIRNDITGRKIAEEEMKVATERYELITQATKDTLWDRDIVNNTTVYNAGIYTMLGYDIADIKDINNWWAKNVHPDDLQKCLNVIAELIKQRKKYAIDEYRFRCADGSYKNIIDRVSIFYDENGDPVRMLGIMQDVTADKQEEKRILKAIIEAQERERTQIGMELHDNVKQILAASKINLEVARAKMDNPELVSDIMLKTIGYLGESILELRKLSHLLAPSFDETFELKDSIVSMISNMDPQKKLNVSIKVDHNKEPLNTPVQTAIFRILQEQFTNILKHSQATGVSIEITQYKQIVHLQISDDGIGFDPLQKKEGIGLENIRRRVQFLNGEFSLNTSPGKGCLIDVIIPLKRSTES